MRRRTLPQFVITVAAGVMATIAAVVPGAASASPGPDHGPSIRHACSAAKTSGRMSCFALVRTDAHPHFPSSARSGTPPTGVGFGAADLQSAYKLPSAGAGAGQTVAIVDAYDLPTAETDLAVYRAANGLPACTSASGCFRKINEHGTTGYLPAPDAGWGVEISLDLDMVSAACPNCHIVLVEADQPATRDLDLAETAAADSGAVAISNSWGGPESQHQLTDDATYFNHPGIAITASSGDSGYGTSWPASSRYVTAVGGTSLARDTTTARGWTETAWILGGSGCSALEPKPAWQHDPGCPARSVADVAAVADPSTGVAVYDTYGVQPNWFEVGGTSVSSPLVAGVYALAGTPKAATYPAAYPYRHPGSLNDITSGANSFGSPCDPMYECNAGTGYDGPTGLGTPNGVAAFTW